MNKENHPLLPSRYAREIDTKVSISYDHSSQRGVYRTMTIDKFATQYGVSSYTEIERLIRETNNQPVREEYRHNLQREKKAHDLEKRLRVAEEKRGSDAFTMLLSGILIAGVFNLLVVALTLLMMRT